MVIALGHHPDIRLNQLQTVGTRVDTVIEG
jgi:hypothetical protein